MADALWLEGETVVQFEIVSNCDLKKQQPVLKLPIGLVDQLRSYKNLLPVLIQLLILSVNTVNYQVLIRLLIKC